MVRTTLLVLLYFIVSFSCGRRAAESHPSWTGRIIIIGNEPFTKVACEDDAGQVYLLQASDSTLTTLRLYQSQRIRIHGSVKQSTETRTLLVDRFDILNE